MSRVPRPGRRARYVAVKAAYGGGTFGGLAGATFALLATEAKLARRAIGLVIDAAAIAAPRWSESANIESLLDALTAGKRATQAGVVVAPHGAASGLLLARAVGERQRDAIGDQSGGRVFLFLETDDFARDHLTYTQRGIRFVEAPRQEPYGMVAVFEDPYGNRWDLIEPIIISG